MEIRGNLTKASNGASNILCIACKTEEDVRNNLSILDSCGYSTLVVQDNEKGGFVILVNPTAEIIASAEAGLVSGEAKAKEA